MPNPLDTLFKSFLFLFNFIQQKNWKQKLLKDPMRQADYLQNLKSNLTKNQMTQRELNQILRTMWNVFPLLMQMSKVCHWVLWIMLFLLILNQWLEKIFQKLPLRKLPGVEDGSSFGHETFWPKLNILLYNNLFSQNIYHPVGKYCIIVILLTS